MMQVFVTPSEVDETEERVEVVRCPCCGGRILDVPYGATVTFSETAPPEPPDYYIKCWRCKRRLGIMKTK